MWAVAATLWAVEIAEALGQVRGISLAFGQFLDTATIGVTLFMAGWELARRYERAQEQKLTAMAEWAQAAGQRAGMGEQSLRMVEGGKR